MRQKHEEVEQFHDFESIKREIDSGDSFRERNASTNCDSGLTMMRPPHHHVIKDKKSDELEIRYPEQFSYSYNTMDDYNGEEQNARILVAHSEPEILNLLMRFLKRRGINIASATAATDAYDKFQKRNRTRKPFEIIVLDTHLAGNKGLTLANKIHQTNPEQRIIVITTTPKHLLRSSVKEIGFLREKDILTMPFRLMDLASLLGDTGQDNIKGSRILNNIITKGN